MEIIPKETNKNLNSKRLFFALDLNQKDKDSISVWCQQYYQSNIKTIKSGNFHITLAFLGNVSINQEQILIKQATLLNQTLVLSSADKNLFADQLGIFNKPQVAYLGFTSFPQQLCSLANSLSNQAKNVVLFQESRPYLPHISVFRKVKTFARIMPFQLNITIKSFSLYHSTSINGQLTYLPIKTWLIR